MSRIDHVVAMWSNFCGTVAGLIENPKKIVAALQTSSGIIAARAPVKATKVGEKQTNFEIRFFIISDVRRDIL